MWAYGGYYSSDIASRAWETLAVFLGTGDLLSLLAAARLPPVRGRSQARYKRIAGSRRRGSQALRGGLLDS